MNKKTDRLLCACNNEGRRQFIEISHALISSVPRSNTCWWTRKGKQRTSVTGFEVRHGFLDVYPKTDLTYKAIPDNLPDPSSWPVFQACFCTSTIFHYLFTMAASTPSHFYKDAQHILDGIDSQFQLKPETLQSLTKAFLDEFAVGLSSYNQPMAMMYALLVTPRKIMILIWFKDQHS